MPKKTIKPRSIYFIGIKGVAMAGVAIMAKQLGYEVRGSDVDEIFPTDEELARNGIEYHSSFDPSHLKPKPDLVVVGTSFSSSSNPEFKAAKSARIPAVTMSEMLGIIMSEFEGVGVAGVHGKTTTTSLLTLLLKNAGFSPSYMIGTSSVPGLENSAAIGDGKFFVAEADDYKRSESDSQPKFLDLPLKHLIVTSIELDHPDVYQTPEQIYNVFYQLSIKIPRDGTIVACSDWPLVKRLVSRLVDRSCITYGFSSNATHQIVELKEGETTSFRIKAGERLIGPIELPLVGKHNVLNATAAVIMAMKLGASEESIVKTLKTVESPQRRFQKLGEYNGALIYDDYAHHPTALDYLFDATRKRFPNKRIVAVFQPHTYSRTGKLLKEFAYSLQAPDKLILLNIWASAREKSGYVTIKDLIDETKKYRSDIEYRSSLEDAAQYLQSILNKDDVLLLIGAGDVYKIYEKIQRD
jgi:UDP-N-acetylmuramate--alanine ligase